MTPSRGRSAPAATLLPGAAGRPANAKRDRTASGGRSPRSAPARCRAPLRARLRRGAVVDHPSSDPGSGGKTQNRGAGVATGTRLAFVRKNIEYGTIAFARSAIRATAAAIPTRAAGGDKKAPPERGQKDWEFEQVKMRMLRCRVPPVKDLRVDRSLVALLTADKSRIKTGPRIARGERSAGS
jgi:hypothetical protein